MKKWLAGVFVVLLLIGTCGEDERTSPTEDSPALGVIDEGSTEDGGDGARAEARRQRAERRRALERRRAKARRARPRRERARRARVAAAAAVEAVEASIEEVPAEATSDCDPNYAGACLDPNASDYDCEGGSGDGPMYTGTVTVVGADPHDLNRDDDNIACDP